MDTPEVVDLTQEESIVIIADDDGGANNNNNPTNQHDVIILDEIHNSSISESTTRHSHLTRPLPRSLNKPPPARPLRTPPGSPPNQLKCPICIEAYVDVKKRGLKVVVTRCGHIFCDFCLKKAISDNGRKCPKCRKNVPKGATGFFEVFDVC